MSLPLFSEEGTVLGRVFAVDPDEDQKLEFSILGSTAPLQSCLDNTLFSSFFAIASDSGRISLSDSSLFNHAVSELSLRVMVEDDGSPSLNNTFEFDDAFM